MPAAPDSHSIVLDTLGKLLERGYGMFGTCLDCVRLYRMDAPAEQRVSSYRHRLAEAGRGARCGELVYSPGAGPLPSLRPSQHRISNYNAALSLLSLAPTPRALAAPLAEVDEIHSVASPRLARSARTRSPYA
jgi:hypothetical protein